ncbi:DUF255 domain-containing protein [Candidatus Woesearchaeota archaeon]|nr:DUF255 domain-containing protein [Candidatus Woesearchaeota archaeon]
MLVSIGYATCHWCHVMAKEAFSNSEIAAFLSEHFVCIKVDREQRPDIDQYFIRKNSSLFCADIADDFVIKYCFLMSLYCL